MVRCRVLAGVLWIATACTPVGTSGHPTLGHVTQADLGGDRSQLGQDDPDFGREQPGFRREQPDLGRTQLDRTDPMPSELPSAISAPRIRVVSAPAIRVVSAKGIQPAAPGGVQSVKGAPSDAPGRGGHSAKGVRSDAPDGRASSDAPDTSVEAGAAASAHLPSPHKSQSDQGPVIKDPADLRKLVGRRDKHTPFAALLGWARSLDIAFEAGDGKKLVKWARDKGLLAASNDQAQPGDLLVFDHVESDAAADLVGIVIARDNRNVIEFLYLGGGVIRRGFCDAKHPSVRRDHGIVVNTYLRSGTRYPPKGTHYLAGELLGHVVHVR